MNIPVFSIIIPVRNCSSYIGQAIESIQNQQSSGFEMEIIVVDDGSVDDSGNIAASLGCTVITIPASGVVKARNIGVKAAKGDFILFLDADDLLNPDALTSLYQPIEDDQTLQIVLALRKDFISPDMTDDEKKLITLKQEPYSGAIAGCALIRRELFDVIGYFDESLRTGEAMDWLLRLQNLGEKIKVKKLDYIAVNRRIHENNTGRVNRLIEYSDYATILKNRLKRN